MKPWIVFLFIVSAFFHALWNFFLKKEADKEKALMLVALLSCPLSLIFAWVMGEHFPPLSNKGYLLAIGSGIFEGIYFKSLSKAYEQASLGKSYAIMRGGAMVGVWILSILFQRDEPSLLGLLGSSLVMLGIWLCQPRESMDRKELFFWSYVSAACIAGYHLFYDFSLHAGFPPIPLFFVSMVATLSIILSTRGKKTLCWVRETSKESWFFYLQLALFTTCSFVLFLSALNYSTPAIAITFRNTSILFACIFGFLLGEKFTTLQKCGVATIVLGVMALAQLKS